MAVDMSMSCMHFLAESHGVFNLRDRADSGALRLSVCVYRHGCEKPQTAGKGQRVDAGVTDTLNVCESRVPGT